MMRLWPFVWPTGVCLFCPGHHFPKLTFHSCTSALLPKLDSMAPTCASGFGTGGAFSHRFGSTFTSFFTSLWVCPYRVRSYNTAFGNDKARSYGQTAVGLGGNISKSIFSCKAGVRPSSIFQSTGEDSGNGSLMRLAPIPIFYSQNPGDAIKHAQLSSLTTHPGQIAAEACGFLSFLIQSAITSGKVLDPKAFLDERAVTYQKVLRGRGATKNGIKQLLLLLDSKLPENSTERRFCKTEIMLIVVYGQVDILNSFSRKTNTRLVAYPQLELEVQEFGDQQNFTTTWSFVQRLPGVPRVLRCLQHGWSGSRTLLRLPYYNVRVYLTVLPLLAQAPTCTVFSCLLTCFRFADAVQRVVNFLGDADSTGVSTYMSVVDRLGDARD